MHKRAKLSTGAAGKVQASRCRGLGGLPFQGPTSTRTLGCSGLALDSAVTRFKSPEGGFPHAILEVSFPEEWRGTPGASRVGTYRDVAPWYVSLRFNSNFMCLLRGDTGSKAAAWPGVCLHGPLETPALSGASPSAPRIGGTLLSGQGRLAPGPVGPDSPTRGAETREPAWQWPWLAAVRGEGWEGREWLKCRL